MDHAFQIDEIYRTYCEPCPFCDYKASCVSPVSMLATGPQFELSAPSRAHINLEHHIDYRHSDPVPA